MFSSPGGGHLIQGGHVHHRSRSFLGGRRSFSQSGGHNAHFKRSFKQPDQNDLAN